MKGKKRTEKERKGKKKERKGEEKERKGKIFTAYISMTPLKDAFTMGFAQ